MRFVTRPPNTAPKSLTEPCDAISRERRDAAKYYFRSDFTAAGFKSYPFDAYRQKDVKSELAKIFKNKCAYCEANVRSNGDDQIEHFRPKGRVEGEIHPGYWWLAHTWENLLPSCGACNQRRLVHILDEFVDAKDFERILGTQSRTSSGKANYFPIAGVRAMSRKQLLADEKPLLIDPTSCDPDNHLTWAFKNDFSLVRPVDHNGILDRTGQETIKAYSLNRVELVANRRAELQMLRLYRARMKRRLRKSGPEDPNWEIEIKAAVQDAQALQRSHRSDQQFTAMKRAYVDHVKVELGSIIIAKEQ